MLSHKGTKRLETNRLILRKFDFDDVEDMFYNWASDKDVTLSLSWQAHSNIEMTKKVLNRWIKCYDNLESYKWAIETKDNNTLIGNISLINVDNRLEKCEIGYCISKPYWNRGIVTEAFKRVISFAFDEISFNRIGGRHQVGNVASGRVMEKCGLKYEGCLREISKNNVGEFVDCKYYSILKKDYLNPKKNDVQIHTVDNVSNNDSITFSVKKRRI
jgi:ribosomal-protein-alanine N-acetyltransferase